MLTGEYLKTLFLFFTLSRKPLTPLPNPYSFIANEEGRNKNKALSYETSILRTY